MPVLKMYRIVHQMKKESILLYDNFLILKKKI